MLSGGGDCSETTSVHRGAPQAGWRGKEVDQILYFSIYVIFIFMSFISPNVIRPPGWSLVLALFCEYIGG